MKLLSKYLVICFFLIKIHCLAFLGLRESNSNIFPNEDATGVQFDLTNAFVTDLSNKDGSRLYFVTHDSGISWKLVSVYDEEKKLYWSWSNDLGVAYYNQGIGVFYYRGKSYDQKGPARVKSITLVGQDGFRLEQSSSTHKKSDLLRTLDGGRRWFKVADLNDWEGIETFDPINEGLIIACIYRYDNEGRKTYFLVKSLDAGHSWKQISNLQNSVNIWATHVFFINEKIGWISSDRDDGLFVTGDGGETWKQISVPERTVSGIFFKDVQNGRIIGGISNNVYETTNGGKNWHVLAKEEILSQSFLDYYKACPSSRINNFILLQTLLKHSK